MLELLGRIFLGGEFGSATSDGTNLALEGGVSDGHYYLALVDPGFSEVLREAIYVDAKCLE